jgi:putative endonuclease
MDSPSRRTGSASSSSPPGMPWADARGLGTYGERIAARYLSDAGLEVLDRNWRCRQGEIDLVARDGACLVVCEVKTRRGTGFGSPVEAVDHRKLARLRRLAAAWLADRRRTPAGLTWRVDAVRVDVVGVLRPRHGACVVEHLRGVVA